jgi:S1-C subfamily serine protease
MRVQMVAVFIITVQAVTLNATDWSAVVVGLEKQVPRIEILAPDAPGPGTCSGVVLNAESGYVLTAAHCTVEKAAYTVNGRHAELVRQNRILDLAVLRTELNDAKAMPLAKDAPRMGEAVGVLGFAFGQKKIHLQVGYVSQPLDDDGAFILDGVVISGESGGAAFNPAGELVGMVGAVKFSHPSMHAAVLVPISKVRDFVQSYLPKQP